MSEEENKNTPEVETPQITIPKTEEASSADIVASKPDSKERQSAVIGSVDRPMTQQRRRGPGSDPRRPKLRAARAIVPRPVDQRHQVGDVHVPRNQHREQEDRVGPSRRHTHVRSARRH